MDFALSHWPFIVVALVFSTFGQVMKGVVFTRRNIEGAFASAIGGRRIIGHLLWWGRKTMPLHPVMAGGAVSFMPGMPAAPGIDTQAELTLYFLGAGVCSTWMFSMLKTFAKKQGYELPSVATDSLPPPSELK